MTTFELVKIALDELYKEGLSEYGEKLDETIKIKIKYLEKSYTELGQGERKPINYQDPATRFAYVYKYVTAHADYVVQILEKLRNAVDGNIFSQENIRVTCIGGGPGSDLIAVLKYLDDHEGDVEKVTCYLLDKEQAWADTWTEIDDSLSLSAALNANFQSLDVTQPDTWKFQKKFLDADLFTMSYFVSEVFALDKDGVVSAFWETLFKNAKSGAIFVYDDNGHGVFNDYFDALWKSAGLECIIKNNNVRFVLRSEEQASEVAEYKEKLTQSPKIQGSVSYRVLRKP